MFSKAVCALLMVTIAQFDLVGALSAPNDKKSPNTNNTGAALCPDGQPPPDMKKCAQGKDCGNGGDQTCVVFDLCGADGCANQGFCCKVSSPSQCADGSTPTASCTDKDFKVASQSCKDNNQYCQSVKLSGENDWQYACCKKTDPMSVPKPQAVDPKYCPDGHGAGLDQCDKDENGKTTTCDSGHQCTYINNSASPGAFCCIRANGQSDNNSCPDGQPPNGDCNVKVTTYAASSCKNDKQVCVFMNSKWQCCNQTSKEG